MRALGLFTLGYMLMALLSPVVAALPALIVFAVASAMLVREPEPGGRQPVRARAARR